MYPLPLPPRSAPISMPPTQLNQLPPTTTFLDIFEPCRIIARKKWIFNFWVLLLIIIILTGVVVTGVLFTSTTKNHDHPTNNNTTFHVPTVEVEDVTLASFVLYDWNLLKMKLTYSMIAHLEVSDDSEFTCHDMFSLVYFHERSEYRLTDYVPLSSNDINSNSSGVWYVTIDRDLFLNVDEAHIFNTEFNEGTLIFDIEVGGNITTTVSNETNFKYICPIYIYIADDMVNWSTCTFIRV